MYKKIMLTVMGLIFAVALASPAKANAQVAIGVRVGPPVVRPYVYVGPPYVYGRVYVGPRYYGPYYYGPRYYPRYYGHPYGYYRYRR